MGSSPTRPARRPAPRPFSPESGLLLVGQFESVSRPFLDGVEHTHPSAVPQLPSMPEGARPVSSASSSNSTPGPWPLKPSIRIAVRKRSPSKAVFPASSCLAPPAQRCCCGRKRRSPPPPIAKPPSLMPQEAPPLRHGTRPPRLSCVRNGGSRRPIWRWVLNPCVYNGGRVSPKQQRFLAFAAVSDRNLHPVLNHRIVPILQFSRQKYEKQGRKREMPSTPGTYFCRQRDQLFCFEGRVQGPLVRALPRPPPWPELSYRGGHKKIASIAGCGPPFQCPVRPPSSAATGRNQLPRR